MNENGNENNNENKNKKHIKTEFIDLVAQS